VSGSRQLLRQVCRSKNRKPKLRSSGAFFFFFFLKILLDSNAVNVNSRRYASAEI
jgi:hypothetical protein